MKTSQKIFNVITHVDREKLTRSEAMELFIVLACEVEAQEIRHSSALIDLASSYKSLAKYHGVQAL